MTMARPQRHPRRAPQIYRAALALALGALAAGLISCSSSSKGLIPVADAGPLQGDFEAVAQAAENGDGSCTQTEAALLKTDQDFAALPPGVDSGLRDTLRQGISNLRTRALALCAQPLPSSTLTTTTPKTTTSTATSTTPPAETQTTTTEPPPSTTPSPSGPGGGTPAPGETRPGEAEGGAGEEGAGGASPGAGAGGGQEAGK